MAFVSRRSSGSCSSPSWRPVSKLEEVGGALVTRTIPPGTYAVLASERGPIARGVSEAWREIWSLDDEQRRRRTDVHLPLRGLR